MPQGLSEDATSDWIDTRDALIAARSVLRLGSAQRGPTQFGRIAKADVGASGDIFVLDADAQEIRVFDRHGSYVDGFGGWGRGPTHLRGATEFHLFPDGRVAVPLGRTGPIKIFRRSGGAWALFDTIDLRPTPSNSLCGMSDGRLFSGGYRRDEDTVVNEFREIEPRSFGSGYDYEQPLIRRALSDGIVECLEKSDRIVFGFAKLPIVRSYAANGRLQWTAAVVEDYLQLWVFETRHPETGAVGYWESTARDHDLLIGVHAVGMGDHLLLQYARHSRDRTGTERRSYLIDAATGEGALINDAATLPLVSSVQPDGYIALFEEPYPYLEIRRVSNLSMRPPSTGVHFDQED